MTLKKDNYYRFIDIMEVFLLIIISVSPVIPLGIKIAIQVILLLNNIKTIFRKDFYILLLLFFLFFIPIVLDLFNITSEFKYSLSNLMYPFTFLCGYFIGKKYDYEYFMFLFERVIFIFACLSLIGMSVFFISPNSIYNFPTYTFNGATHRTILFFNYLLVGDWMAVRNTGIAWEPGVFQLLLNMGLLISIRSTQKNRIFKLSIYIISIYFTKSTVGLLLLAINVLLILKENKKYIPLLVLIIIVFFHELYLEYIYQLSFKWTGSSAFNYRYIPSANAIKHFWYKFYGIGATKYNQIYQTLRVGSFDSYTQILMRFGYPLLFFIIYSILSIIRKDIIMAIIILISFLGEPLWGTILFTSIYFINNNKRKIANK